MPDSRQLKWDIRMLHQAILVSTWSKDPSTKAGAIIADNNLVVSAGFNGFPQLMPDNPDWYTDREEKYSRVVHCEINAAILARRPVYGCTLYTWPFASCDRCCVQMIQYGIVRFVFPTPTTDALARWAAALEKTKRYIKECGLDYCEIPREKVIETFPKLSG
jgi:dCMP deaminase